MSQNPCQGEMKWRMVLNIVYFEKPTLGGKEPYAMRTKVLPSQQLFKHFQDRISLGEMSLSDVVRSGAQLMLQFAVEQEMSEFLGRAYYRNDPDTTGTRGRRNGYEPHTVLTGEGPIEVQVPQARDLPEGSDGFRSKILDAYATRTETLDELITRMYVTGMSTRDIETTFSEVLAGRGVSRSTVSKVTERLNEDLEAFRCRDLSNENVLYLFLDGTYVKYRLEAERKEPVLAAYGIREDGSKVLLHVGPGSRESYEAWHTFLQEMTTRGLKTPLLTATDGNAGVVRAVEEVFPLSLRQRCQKHRMNNILSKVPEKATAMLRKEIHKCFHADSYDEGLKIGRQIIERFKDRFPSAMGCLADDLEACIQNLKLPKVHHKRTRTTNLLERLFGENRRRVKVIPHFFSEQAGMKLIYATLLAASKKWRGMTMDPFTHQAIDDLWQDVFGKSRKDTWAA
jgi:putative transposase